MEQQQNGVQSVFFVVEGERMMTTHVKIIHTYLWGFSFSSTIYAFAH